MRSRNSPLALLRDKYTFHLSGSGCSYRRDGEVLRIPGIQYVRERMDIRECSGKKAKGGTGSQ